MGKADYSRCDLFSLGMVLEGLGKSVMDVKGETDCESLLLQPHAQTALIHSKCPYCSTTNSMLNSSPPGSARTGPDLNDCIYNMGQTRSLASPPLSGKDQFYANSYARLSRGSPLPLKVADLAPLFPSERLAAVFHSYLATASGFIQTAKVLTEFKPSDIIIPALYRLLEMSVLSRFLAILSPIKADPLPFATCLALFKDLAAFLCGESDQLQHFFGEVVQQQECVGLQQLGERIARVFPRLPYELNRKIKQAFSQSWRPGQRVSFLPLAQETLFTLSSQLFQADFRSLLYDSNVHGRSINALAARLSGFRGRWLLLLKHQGGVLGTLQSGGFNQSPKAQGTSDSLLFQLSPKLRIAYPDEGKGGANYFYFFSSDKLKKGLGAGFDPSLKFFKIWVDDVSARTSFQFCPTYGSILLAEQEKLSLLRLQVVGLCRHGDLEALSQFQQDKDRERERKRKVLNKEELLQDARNGLLNQTFRHREQVQGQQ